MAILITSAPVQVPTGIRMTAGTLNFNSTTYGAGGLAVTVAQWGGGVNGIPNRNPDFVIFTASTDAAANGTASACVHRFIASTGKVTCYGDEPLVDEGGLGEDDAAANLSVSNFLAIWVTPDPAGVVTQ